MSETQTWDGPARGEKWEPPEMTKSKDLVATAADLVTQGKPAYEAYSKELILLAKQTLLPAGASDADLFFLFQLAGKYQLDPFAREIWLVPMRQKDERDQWQTRAVPIIGRDGLLALSERNPYYAGHRAMTVHEHDHYEVLDEPRELKSGRLSYVRHSYSGFTGEARGAIVGAWCEVYLKERETVLFEAPLDEYIPSGKKLEYSPWSKQLSLMIRKCAIVNGFREATRVSGVYFEEEMLFAMERGVKRELQAEEPVPVEVAYPADPWWAERLRTLFDAAEAAKPGSFLPAKRAIMLEAAYEAEAGEDSLQALEVELVTFIDKAGAVPPSAPERAVEGEWEEQQAAAAQADSGEQESLLAEE